MTFFTKNIDWLSITFPDSYKFKKGWSDDFVLMGRGLHGYSEKWIGRNFGIVVQAKSAMQAMGTNVVLSGQALHDYRSNFGLSDKNLAVRIQEDGGRASRIDLALTIIDGYITPEKMRLSMAMGELTFAARKSQFLNGRNGDHTGDTLYVGSRESERYFRCYDKCAEQGIVDGAAMIRLELEFKGLMARAAMHSVAHHGASATVNTQMREFVKWGDTEFNTATSGESAPFTPIGRRETNTEKWLIDAVSPSLAKAIRLNPNFLNYFKREVKKHMRRLDNTATDAE